MSPIISLHTLAGVLFGGDYRIMNVSGHIRGQKVHILIDSGSTHNFINIDTVERLEYDVLIIALIALVVPNRNIIHCNKGFAGLKWKMQGWEFQADLLVLPLDDCQMVLGIQC